MTPYMFTYTVEGKRKGCFVLLRKGKEKKVRANRGFAIDVRGDTLFLKSKGKDPAARRGKKGPRELTESEGEWSPLSKREKRKGKKFTSNREGGEQGGITSSTSSKKGEGNINLIDGKGNKELEKGKTRRNPSHSANATY